MPEKIPKSAALYFKPATIDRPGGARCGACWKFILSGACVEVKGEIEKAKVCGLYVHGKPFDKDPGFILTQVSKEEAGYGDGDTHCGNCEYMARKREAYSPCEEVEGLVEPLGCCNRHDF
jgi:hypothetical protein